MPKQTDTKPATRRLRKGEIGELEITRCHARWYDGRRIHSCGLDATRGKRRCAEHAPDGSRLSPAGIPLGADL